MKYREAVEIFLRKMNIQEITNWEENNQGIIRIYKEGIFWRAYETTLYLLTTHIKPLKVLVRRYKNIGQDIVYGGFPDSVLTEVLNKCKEKNLSVKQEDLPAGQTGKIIEIGNFSMENEKFVQWKDEKVFAKNELISMVKEPEIKYKTKEASIIEEIKIFPLAHSTPIETQQFLYQLQQKLNN